jgi:protein LTV1
MVDEFLNDYEILGRRMRPKLEGETGAEKLGTFREAIGIDERVRIQQEGDDGDPEAFEFVEEDKKDRWDCETILCASRLIVVSSFIYPFLATYSNLENHPRMIRARTSKPIPKITLDPRTGLPTVAEANERPTNKRAANRRQPKYDSENTDSDDDSDATEMGELRRPYRRVCISLLPRPPRTRRWTQS